MISFPLGVTTILNLFLKGRAMQTTGNGNGAGLPLDQDLEWAVKDRFYKRAFQFYQDLGEFLDSFRLRDRRYRVGEGSSEESQAVEYDFTAEQKRSIQEEIVKMERSSSVAEMIEFLNQMGRGVR